ncbi:MAG: ABC transporter ATP-binding protein [Gaiellales bacterium]
MAASMPAEKPMQFVASTKRLLRRLGGERVAITAVIVSALTSVALMVLGPRLMGRATDIIFSGVIGKRLPAGTSQAKAVESARAAGNDNFADMLNKMDVVPGVGVDMSTLGRVLVLMIVIYVAASLLAWLQGYVLTGAVQRTVYDLRSDVEEKLHSVPLSYLDGQPRGELLSRVTNDIDNIAQSLQQTLSQLLTSLLTVVGVLAMMIILSPLLAVIALITIPLSLYVTKLIAGRSQGLFVKQWRHTGTLNAHVEEAFTGHELVRVFGRHAQVEAEFDRRNAELYDASFGAQFVSGMIMPMMMFIGNLNYVMIAVVGGLRVATGSMSLGDVQAFIQYSRQFTHPLSQVASMINVMQSGVASAERVFDLLDAPEQRPEATGTELATGGRGRIEFEHVTFSYDEEHPLIEDLSLIAEPGSTVAIVGPTGAGKTTLVNLIMRFYELNAGRILLDGVDITDLRRDTLRGEIGMVLQDAWLFEGSIRDNIAYGRPDATEEQIHAAAEATFVDRFVHSLPDGYDTILDDAGSNISAGEQQLITIARAFVSQPSLLILDEATSSVDTRTELLVQQAMAALRAERTSFVIAHRLSTIRDADLILVMEDGSIVEQGSHEELIAAKGAYHSLYSAQFEGAPVEA